MRLYKLSFSDFYKFHTVSARTMPRRANLAGTSFAEMDHRRHERETLRADLEHLRREKLFLTNELEGLRRERNTFINRKVRGKRLASEAAKEEAEQAKAEMELSALKAAKEQLEVSLRHSRISNKMTEHLRNVEMQKMREQLASEQEEGRLQRGEGIHGLSEAELLALAEKLETCHDTAQERVARMLQRRKAEAVVLENNPDFMCPISQMLMRDPVLTDDGTGKSYERKHIEKWIQICKDKDDPITSPLNRATLNSEALTANDELRLKIEAAVDLELGGASGRAAKRACQRAN